jgi:DinB superfamily
MEFDLQRSIEVLRQTPYSLQRMLDGLSEEWTRDGGCREDWSPFDVLGHLIHGEQTDWMARAEIILAQGEKRTFARFDRLAQFEESKGKTLDDLLTEFAYARNTNLEKLMRWQLDEQKLDLTGIHPTFGEVMLRQLLATWVVHDLNHIRQIVRFMARKYDSAVGPWKEYLAILK